MKRSTFLTSTAAGAAGALAVPRFTLAAGPAATVKIGFLESFSGVFTDQGSVHRLGADLAIADFNKKSGRVKYEFVYGDDGSKPATATTEARRLIDQEKVDVLFGGTSSAIGLSMNALALELGVFDLLIGPQDSSITADKASKLTYRFGPNIRMMLKPLVRRALALGKKWYFLQADYAFGKDGYAQLSDALKRAGGTEVGHDVVPLGTSDYSSVLTKLRNSDAEVFALCVSGLDAANAAKQWATFGLNKKQKLIGISLEDTYWKAVPLDAVQGATFPVLWSPTVSPSAAKLAARLRQGIKGPVGGRHYLGYMAAWSLMDRMSQAGTTKADKLMAAFENYSFDAAKASRATYHACDHQCAQDIYAGTVVPQKKFDKTQFMFDIVSEVPAPEADNCGESYAKAASSAMASQKIADRANYSPKTWS
jgi:branched-chain amino acid transport system substrate-binding protein